MRNIPDPNFFGGDVELAHSNDECETLDSEDHPFVKTTMEDSKEISRPLSCSVTLGGLRIRLVPLLVALPAILPSMALQGNH